MVGERYRPKFVGFYWTLSVTWKGMTDNFTDIEQAVRESRTIRYQREQALDYVRRHNGEMVAEIPYRDVSNDRMTEYLQGEVERAVKLCKEGATLLWVRFEECGWRHHRFISTVLNRYDVDNVPLPPERVSWFNPVEHFSSWRVREELERERRRIEVPQKLREAMESIPECRGRNRLIAEWLNERGVPTFGGKLEWKDDNVRKALKDMAEGPTMEAPPAPAF